MYLIRRRRRWPGVAVVGVAGLLVALIASPAYAKATIRVRVSQRTAHPGSWLRVTGTGGDDAPSFNQFCLQRRLGRRPWITLRCTPRRRSGIGSLSVVVRAGRPGVESYRGIVLTAASPSGAARLKLASRPVTVTVR